MEESQDQQIEQLERDLQNALNAKGGARTDTEFQVAQALSVDLFKRSRKRYLERNRLEEWGQDKERRTPPPQ